jgi:hypothetical protein
MSAIVLDDQLRARLNGLNETLEVQEPNGTTVGRFVPEELYKKLVYALLNPPYSEAEVARRRAEPGGRALTEFWRERAGG